MPNATIKPESILVAGSEDHYTSVSFKLNAPNNLKSYRINKGPEITLSASVWGDANNITRSNANTVAGKNIFYLTDVLGNVSSTIFYMANKDNLAPVFKEGEEEIEFISTSNFGTLTNTLTVSVPENYKKDDLLILTISCGNAKDVIKIPDGWQKLIETAGGVTYYGDIRVYYKFAKENEPATYNFVQEGSIVNGSAGVIVCLRNVDLDTPFAVWDYLNQTDASVLTAVAPSLNYSEKKAFQLRGYAVRNQISTWTYPSGEVELGRYFGSSRGNILILGREQELGSELLVGFNIAYRTSTYSIAFNSAPRKPGPDPEPTGKGKLMFEQNMFKKIMFESKEYIRALFEDVVIWSKGAIPPVPYPEKILLSSGTQYIDTLIYGSSDIKIEMKIRGTKNTGTVGLFGSRQTGTTGSFITWYLGSQFRFDYGGETNKTYTGLLDTKEPFIIKREGKFSYINDVLVQTNTSSTFTNTMNFLLFAVNSQGVVDNRMSSLELYWCKIWNGTELVRDFIPVEIGDIVDGLTTPSNCLYDKVTKSFYENKGEGVFDIVKTEPIIKDEVLFIGSKTAKVAGTTLNGELPTYNVGDFLLSILVSEADNPNYATPSGWTKIDLEYMSDFYITAFYKFAVSNEVEPVFVQTVSKKQVSIISSFRNVNIYLPLKESFYNSKNVNVSSMISLEPKATDGEYITSIWGMNNNVGEMEIPNALLNIGRIENNATLVMLGDVFSTYDGPKTLSWTNARKSATATIVLTNKLKPIIRVNKNRKGYFKNGEIFNQTLEENTPEYEASADLLLYSVKAINVDTGSYAMNNVDINATTKRGKITHFADGKYNFTAEDLEGNISDILTLTFDKTPPVVTIRDNDNNILSDFVSVSLSQVDTRFGISVSDSNLGKFYVNGVEYSQYDGASSYNINWIINQRGPQLYELRFVDKAGNETLRIINVISG